MLKRETVTPSAGPPIPVPVVELEIPSRDPTTRPGVLDVLIRGGATTGARLTLRALDPARRERDVTMILGDLESSHGLLRLDALAICEWRAVLDWPETGVSIPAATDENLQFSLGEAPVRLKFNLRGLGAVQVSLLDPSGSPWTGPAFITIEALQVLEPPHGARVVAQREQAPYVLTGIPAGLWAFYARRTDPKASEKVSGTAQCKVKARETALVTITLVE